MGGSSSREGSWRRNSSRASSSASSWSEYPHGQESHQNYAPPQQYPYAPQQYPYAPQQSFSSAPQQSYSYGSSQYHDSPPSQDQRGSHAADGRRRLDRRYSRIADNYNSLDEVIMICQYSLYDCDWWFPVFFLAMAIVWGLYTLWILMILMKCLKEYSTLLECGAFFILIFSIKFNKISCNFMQLWDYLLGLTFVRL